MTLIASASDGVAHRLHVSKLLLLNDEAAEWSYAAHVLIVALSYVEKCVFIAV